MDFRKELLKGHSKQITMEITREIISKPGRMEELVHLFLHDERSVTQRASWPLSVIAEHQSNLLFPYMELLLDKLEIEGEHPAIRRNIVRAFQYMKIPEEFQGRTTDICFKLLNSPSEPIAVRAFCMTVLFNVSKEWPELQRELKVSIEDQMENYSSAGIVSRGKKILKQLNIEE